MKIRWNKKILVTVPILAIILIIIIFMNNRYGDYLTLEDEMGIYKLAEEKLTNGWDEAKAICSKFKNDKKISECYYNLILPFLQNMDQSVLKYSLEQLEKTCGDMLDNAWKGECYFLLADYVRYTDIKKAASLCNLSQTAYALPCYNNVASKIGLTYDFTKSLDSAAIENNAFTPKKKALEFCEFAEISYKQECYRGFGVAMAWWFVPNIELSLEECNKLDKLFRNSCYLGVSDHIGFSYSKNFTLVSYLCNKMKGQSRRNCYYKLGFSIATHHPYNASEAFKICDGINKEYIFVCKEGVQFFNFTDL